VSAIRVFQARHVELAVSPAEAVDAVREAFVAHASGTWTMPPKVYLTNYPAGDFRAMPALGAGYALLKWVSSFPGNPARGLPTVGGAVLLCDAESGELKAVLDAAAVTSLRTGAAAVLAAETLARTDARSASVIGAGVNGAAAARSFIARGRPVGVWDIDPERAKRVAEAIGAQPLASQEDALAADIVVSVTPGLTVVFEQGSLRSGQHVSLMGADGPGKAEIDPAELLGAASAEGEPSPAEQGARAPEPPRRLFCDDWVQASHSGDLAQLAATGQIERQGVTELGAVLTGAADGRRSPEEITLFDSTGLAIQDLAIAVACMRRADALALPTLEL
jgi:ornithine cyclodeaminase/alanine dehydrogenase-like protein (mu-crystallin family)